MDLGNASRRTSAFSAPAPGPRPAGQRGLGEVILESFLRPDSGILWDHSARAVAGVLLLTFLVIAAGCRRDVTMVKDRAKRQSSEVEGSQRARDNFNMAWDFIENYDAYEPQAATEKILFHLQKWAQEQRPADDWLADPLFGRLPRRFDPIKTPAALSQLRFMPYDITMLREALWTQDLARQIAARELEDRQLDRWIERQQPRVGEQGVQDLRTVAGLFDWVIRNIQAAPADPPAKTGSDSATVSPPPGARYLASEALLLGKGDWLVRSRILILLARQAGIPVVILAVDGEPEPEPWLPAAFIGDHLFLFDTRLGLPLPGPGDSGIATLAEVIENPALIRQLDTPRHRYPLEAADLERIICLIDATPAYLSQRMALMESNLTGPRKTLLTCAPSALSLELRKLKGVTNVALWSMPYDAFMYRQQLQQGGQRQQLWALEQELRMVRGRTPLAAARQQHFRGMYADQPDHDGAKSLYMACRFPDAVISQLRNPQQLKAVLGDSAELPEDPARLAQLVAATRESMQKAKASASYWLGMIAFEEGSYEVAINYLQKRVLQANPDGPWTQGATYNLGRAEEHLGRERNDRERLRTARELYLRCPDSPQAPGNEIRARRLDALLADEARLDYFQGNGFPVNRSQTSTYFSRVLVTISAGSAGGGLPLSQAVASSQSRTNCLSNDGGL